MQISSHYLSLRKALVASFAIPIFAFAALAGGGGRAAAVAAPTVTDSHGPMDLTGITIKNFGIVDGRIFRGEQPGKDDDGIDLPASAGAWEETKLLPNQTLTARR
jgi:hypothetical protein